MATNSEDSKLVLNSILDFICYEFCKNECSSSAIQQSEDVSSFFESKIVMQTTKPSADVTPYEILTYFLDEIKSCDSINKFKQVRNRARTLIKLYPSLKSTTYELLVELQSNARKGILGEKQWAKNPKVQVLIQEFASEVVGILQLPPLLEKVSSMEAESHDMTNICIEALRSKLKEDDIPAILQLLE